MVNDCKYSCNLEARAYDKNEESPAGKTCTRHIISGNHPTKTAFLKLTVCAMRSKNSKILTLYNALIIYTIMILRVIIV